MSVCKVRAVNGKHQVWGQEPLDNNRSYHAGPKAITMLTEM